MPATNVVAEKVSHARVSPGQVDSTGRLVAPPNPKGKLAAMFREIEETLLPRKLTFKIGDRHTLHIDVGSRRPYKVVGVESDVDASTYQLAFANRDQENLKAQIEEIAKLFAEFVHQNGAMSVVSQLTSIDYRSSEVGYSLTELKKLCDKIGISDADETAEVAAEAVAEEPEIDVDPIEDEAGEAEPDVVAEAAAEERFGELSEDITDEGDDEDDQPSLASLEERLKSVAAAVGDVAKPAPKPAKPAAPATPVLETIEDYFEACKSCAINGVLLANDGAVLAVFGRGVQENWLDIAGHAAKDFTNWIEVAGWALGKTQLLVLKGQHFEDSSIAVLFMKDQYAAITMRNLDLNKVMKLGMEVLAQRPKE